MYSGTQFLPKVISCKDVVKVNIFKTILQYHSQDILTLMVLNYRTFPSPQEFVTLLFYSHTCFLPLYSFLSPWQTLICFPFCNFVTSRMSYIHINRNIQDVTFWTGFFKYSISFFVVVVEKYSMLWCTWVYLTITCWKIPRLLQFLAIRNKAPINIHA